MPDSNTFDIQPIRSLVEHYLRNSTVSVDPFSRDKRWATHTNDLNPNTKAEHHLEAAKFLEMLYEQGVRADLGLFDPPYSTTQAKEVYQSIGIETLPLAISQGWRTEREGLAKVISPDGVVISCGWNSAGMGLRRGFRIERILLVAHGREHNDTIVTVERKISGTQEKLF